MPRSPKACILLWSVGVSGIVHLFLISSAFVGGARSGFRKVADAIAGPPGFISIRLLAPREHRTGAFVTAALFSLAVSLLFYAIVSYALIYAARLLRLWRDDSD